MSRKKPKIYKRSTANNRIVEVISSEGCFIVLRDGKQFNLRHQNADGPKYAKTMFVNKAHAIRLAKKMNRMFRTRVFTVIVVDVALGTQLDLNND